MKTVTVPSQATEVQRFLEQARHEDIVQRTADGTEHLVSVVDNFDHEIARTRQHSKLLALLDERSREAPRISLADVKRELGL